MPSAQSPVKTGNDESLPIVQEEAAPDESLSALRAENARLREEAAHLKEELASTEGWIALLERDCDCLRAALGLLEVPQ